MPALATKTTPEALRNLPTSARRNVNADDVVVPDGYKVEALLVGLSVPTGIEFADDGTLFIAEGGATWPTRPGMSTRIFQLDGTGRLEVFANENLGGPRTMAYHEGYLYVSIKGGYYSRIVRYDLKTREREILIDKLPSGGWHEPGGPVFGPDGLMYFGQGSISLNGIIGPAGFTVDTAKHPNAHDIPGVDVELTGDNDWSRSPVNDYPYPKETGAFKPYGVPSKKGEVIKGETFCSTCVMRSKPDGTEPELLAWGVRNPWGMVFDEDGDLYVVNLCMEEKDPRPIGQDPGSVFRIKNAKTPHGSVTTPDWYGFPDISADGLPVWDPAHAPMRGTAPTPLIANPPEWAGPAVYLNEPHTGNSKMDYCASDEFGYRGKMFLCQYGTYWPLNSMRPHHENNGFNIVAFDRHTGEAEVFMRNAKPGPASAHPGTGGLERPVDCKFSPDGKSLYVLDFGLQPVLKGTVFVYGHTGVLWRITKQ